jgi:hypothetical protein
MENNKSIRVGVLTFHNGPNFGGSLQAWHLVHAIRSLGYTCHAVNYLHPVHQENNRARIPVTSLSGLRARAFWLLKKHGFRSLERSICRHKFTDQINEVPWDDFDMFVVGSDIVWDYQQASFGRDPVYFGMVPGLKGKPIISYAASCGPASTRGPFPDFVAEGLQNFASLGVRDTATAELVKTASGRDSTIVVDPTWLGSEPSFTWKGLPTRKYLFVYGVRRIDAQMGETIRAYCREKGLEFVSALTPCRSADRMYRVLTPFQWAELFRNAEATIVLGTLHGTAYSIKYGKPFLLITSPTTTQKISSVLDRIGQGFRLLEVEDFTADAFDLLDESKYPAPAVPAEWRNQSLDFLKNSLAAATSVAR